MKHIKSINEFYRRTAGFRYSEPKLGNLIECYYVGSVTEEEVKEILESINIKFDNFNFNSEKKSIEAESGNVEVDGTIGFDLYVYNEREVDEILNNFSRTLYVDYGTKIVDFYVKEHSKKKFERIR